MTRSSEHLFNELVVVIKQHCTLYLAFSMATTNVQQIVWNWNEKEFVLGVWGLDMTGTALEQSSRLLEVTEHNSCQNFVYPKDCHCHWVIMDPLKRPLTSFKRGHPEVNLEFIVQYSIFWGVHSWWQKKKHTKLALCRSHVQAADVVFFSGWLDLG